MFALVNPLRKTLFQWKRVRSPTLAPLTVISSEGWTMKVSPMSESRGKRVRKDSDTARTMRMMLCGLRRKDRAWLAMVMSGILFCGARGVGEEGADGPKPAARAPHGLGPGHHWEMLLTNSSTSARFSKRYWGSSCTRRGLQ